MEALRRIGFYGAELSGRLKRNAPLLAIGLIAMTRTSLTVLAADFQATVKLTHYRDDQRSTENFTEDQLLEGITFGSGFRVQSKIGSQLRRSTESSAVVSNTVYSLLTKDPGPRDKTPPYRAMLERGIVSRFLSKGPQVVALSLANEADWEEVARGDTKIALSLGEPFPEYFNTYLLDRTGWPDRLRVEARAPNFLVGSTGIVAMPKPYDTGFKRWTLDVSYSDGRPASASFKQYTPLDSAVEDAQAGKLPTRLEALSVAVDVAFKWSAIPSGLDRLPVPPTLPFNMEDHRYVYDTYTNNRVSTMVEGAAVLSCSNADWSYPVELALRASSFVKRGLEARDIASRRPWLRPLFLVICLAVLAFPTLLVWRRSRKPTEPTNTNKEIIQ